MEIIKSCLQLIVDAASRPDLGVVFGLLIFYLSMVAVLFLVRIVRGVRK